ncbi:hypothetical protein [Pseudomonas sp.]|uniref:hypothetical protein n=1 Tax=Pseudomonas sp. TaxID=306 RepID=UPI0028A65A05|nr:hypothetical protein [Pseudomonas sp.]
MYRNTINELATRAIEASDYSKQELQQIYKHMIGQKQDRENQRMYRMVGILLGMSSVITAALLIGVLRQPVWVAITVGLIPYACVAAISLIGFYRKQVKAQELDRQIAEAKAELAALQ